MMDLVAKYIADEAEKRGYEKYILQFCFYEKLDTLGENKTLEASQNGFIVIADEWITPTKNGYMQLQGKTNIFRFAENSIDVHFKDADTMHFQRVLTMEYPIKIVLEKAKGALHYIKVIPV